MFSRKSSFVTVVKFLNVIGGFNKTNPFLSISIHFRLQFIFPLFLFTLEKREKMNGAKSLAKKNKSHIFLLKDTNA